MGLQLEYIQFINDAVQAAGFGSTQGLRMCELGNQHIRKSASKHTKAKTGKEYFTNLGYRHTSIDWNGQDGALPLDLTQSIEDPSLVGQFDVLTNSGTTEHVTDQYACFRNLHRLVKPGGVLVHLNPMTGSWPGHGIHYYTFDFHLRLAAACGYQILKQSDISAKGEQCHLVCVGLRKPSDKPFIERPDFERIAHGTILSA